MKQWLTLLGKENLEMWRNFKWVWVPLTFILIGVKTPISNYYMPQILKSVGDLPQAVIDAMPKANGPQSLAQGLSEYTTLGVLIIVLSMMGTIAAERKSGVAAMILVKPVSYPAYVTAKWGAGLLLVLVSFFVGGLATWYYTGVLFEWIPFGEFLQSFLIYGLWFTVIVTLTVFFSAAVLSPGVAAFTTLAVVIVISIISSTLSNVLEWSPAQLGGYANEILLNHTVSNHVLPASLVAAAVIIVFLVLSTIIFRKKELAA